MPIAEATGSTSPLGRGARRDMVQDAMAQAVVDASKECEAIFARTDLSDEDKKAQIDAIVHPDELRRRKQAAREAAKGKFAEVANAAAAEAAAASAAKTDK